MCDRMDRYKNCLSHLEQVVGTQLSASTSSQASTFNQTTLAVQPQVSQLSPSARLSFASTSPFIVPPTNFTRASSQPQLQQPNPIEDNVPVTRQEIQLIGGQFDSLTSTLSNLATMVDRMSSPSNH